jgi:hypothetical protein
VSQKTVYKWSACFCGGGEEIEDEQRSGHQLTLATDKNKLTINEIIQENRD